MKHDVNQLDTDAWTQRQNVRNANVLVYPRSIFSTFEPGLFLVWRLCRSQGELCGMANLAWRKVAALMTDRRAVIASNV